MKQISMILLFLTIPAWAWEYINIDSARTNTSDDISFSTISLKAESNRRELLYPYQNEKSKQIDYGLNAWVRSGNSQQYNFNGHEVLGMVRLVPNKEHMFTARAGYHFLKGDSTQMNQPQWKRVVGELFYENRSFNGIYSSLLFSSDFAYVDLMLPKGIEKGLVQNKIKNHLLITKYKNIRIQNRLSHSRLSDHNNKWHDDFDLKFNLGITDIWLWAGLGAEYTRFDKDINGYWTPRRHISVGPRVELTLNLIDRIYLNHGTNLNRFYDENSQYGTGYYTVSSFQYGARDKRNVRIGFERLLSRQNSKNWSSNQFFITGNIFF